MLSTFCQASVPAPCSTYIAQSPTFQSVIPLKFVEPATVTIQNCPLLGDEDGGLPVLASQFPSNAKPEGIVPIAVFIAVCICAPVAKFAEEELTAPVIAATVREQLMNHSHLL